MFIPLFIYSFVSIYFCLCPPRLTIIMNFDISIVAYVAQTTWPKTYQPLWIMRLMYQACKSIFKNINIGCLGSYFVVWHLKPKRIAIIVSCRHNASKIAELPQRFLKQGRHLQVGEVSFRSFLFWFFFFFLCIHVIDLYEIIEIRQKSCPTKSLLHMTYMLVYLRTKRKQVKELIARGTKGS